MPNEARAADVKKKQGETPSKRLTLSLCPRRLIRRAALPLCLKGARVLTFRLKFTEIFSPYSFAEEEH